ncbi:MAG TPA: hypothetical protein VGJ20_38935 [Xanthobacteraceae bacterium]
MQAALAGDPVVDKALLFDPFELGGDTLDATVVGVDRRCYSAVCGHAARTA